MARNVVLHVAGTLRPIASAPALRALYLHSVYDDQREAFRDLLQRIKQLGRFVSLGEVEAVVAGRVKPDRHWFHLSFDDGFDNVYRNAFPILQELEVPACVFVPTQLIGAPDSYISEHWWVTWPVNAKTRTMDWESVRAMHKAGIEIGSHTRLHKRLSTISGSAAELHAEIAGSKNDIEQAIGAPCRAISWPYGTKNDVDDRALEAVRDAGYELCFSAIRGRISSDTPRLQVPRHLIEPDWPWSHVRFFASGGLERAR